MKIDTFSLNYGGAESSSKVSHTSFVSFLYIISNFLLSLAAEILELSLKRTPESWLDKVYPTPYLAE